MGADEELAAAKERAWRQAARIDGAYERGEIDTAGWHAAWLAIVEPAYLAADNPRAQSGHSGDAAGWERARRLLTDALPGNCTLLDIGCANGHLMESLVDWAGQDGIAVEPYGVDISAWLADLARRRCPQWADRIVTVNAADWRPPRRFDVVRTGLEYVPAARAAAYLAHLFDHVVAPGGRLVIGVYNEERDLTTLEDRVRGYGYDVTGTTSRPHRHPALSYKALWIDAR
jgi:2-polyprenyl-3-methyl-5-hydroxy-6-metoxy-1,4-benzoquinol methylase